MLLVSLLVPIVLAAALFAWYCWCLRQYRGRAAELLGWIESTLGAPADFSSIEWLGPSKFRVALRVAPESVFRRAAVLVKLVPRELPHHWGHWVWSGEEETASFEADFEVAPKIDIRLHTLKLFARTRPDLEPIGKGWQFDQVVPLVITTREEWQREVKGVVTSLLHIKQKQFLSLRLEPNSPHYVVTLPLGAISPECETRLQVASTIRELAVEASSYHGLNY
ncbi:MAG: hypothetical protein ABI383_15295 [Acidobacteriaceae bacterium]